MAPQFSCPARKHFQGLTSYRAQPYAPYSIRNAEFLSPYDTMTDQSIANIESSGNATMRGKKGKGPKRNVEKNGAEIGKERGRNNSELQLKQPNQESDSRQIHSIPSVIHENAAFTTSQDSLTGGLSLGDPDVVSEAGHTANASALPSDVPSNSSNWYPQSPSQQHFTSLLQAGNKIPRAPKQRQGRITGYNPGKPQAQTIAQNQQFSTISGSNLVAGPRGSGRRSQRLANKSASAESTPSISVDAEFSKLSLHSSYENQSTRRTTGNAFTGSSKAIPEAKPGKRKGNRPKAQQSPKVSFPGEDPKLHDEGELNRIGYLQRMGFIEDELQLPAPIPSKIYEETCSRPNWMIENANRRKLLVILDLNGTLLLRLRGDNGMKDSINPIHRPSLTQFLDYVFREHHVAIFSSAMQGSVLKMLRSVIPVTYRSKILRIFTREDMGLPRQYFFHKVTTYKHLTMVWKLLSRRDGDFSQYDTILIDDSDKKAASEPQNHIMLPEFTAEVYDRGDDDALRKVAGYIEEARKWHNVSAFIKSTPFDINTTYPTPATWDDNGEAQPLPASGSTATIKAKSSATAESVERDELASLSADWSDGSNGGVRVNSDDIKF